MVDLLGNAMEAGPALTLGNPDVDILLTRARAYQAAPDSQQDKAAQDAMSQAVASDAEAMGDRLRDLEVRVDGNMPVLATAAQTYGPVFAEWFLASVSKLQEVAAVVASLPDRRRDDS